MDATAIRPYKPSDYTQLKALYTDNATYGGQFDEARDGEERLKVLTKNDPEAILVAESDSQLLGSISLIEDGRVAILFRFAVKDHDLQVANLLLESAAGILNGRGHSQILVYAPADDRAFEERYRSLRFNKGQDYTCYWKAI